MAEPSLVIFDIGSTLVSGPPEGPAARLAAALGWSSELKRQVHSALMTRDFRSADEVVAFLTDSLGVHDEALSSQVNQLWEDQEHETRAVDGALAAITALHEKDLRLGLISNIWQPYLSSVRRDFGAQFDRCIDKDLQLFSFEVGHAKPSLEMFERAISAAGVATSNVVMVGDSYAEDIVPAMDLGIVTIWVLSRPQKESANKQKVDSGEVRRPSAIVNSVAEVDHALVARAIEENLGNASHANSLD